MYLRHGRDYIDLEERDDHGRTRLLQMLEEFTHFPIDVLDHDCGVGDMMIRKTQILLSHGVDIDTRDNLGQGCLHAILSGSFPGLVNSRTSCHEGSVIAVIRGIIKVLAYLIRMGADIHAVDNEGFSATEYAHSWRWGRLWEEALRECELDVQEIYIRDYRLGGKMSDDIYAPDGGHPRLVHTLDRVYYVKGWNSATINVNVLLLEPLNDMRQALSRFIDLSDAEHSEHDEKSPDFSDHDEESQYPDYDIGDGGNEDTPLNAEDISEDNQKLGIGETDDAAECSDSDDDTGGVPIV